MGLGISNSNYRVCTGSEQDYILKISNDKPKEQLQQEQKILSVLKNGFRHSLRPILTQSKEEVYEYEDFVGVVYPFIKGVIPEINTDLLSKQGEALGELHNLNLKNNFRPMPTLDILQERSMNTPKQMTAWHTF